MTLTRDQTMESRLDELSERIDFLVAEAEERRKLRESISELTGDLTPVTKQGMDSLTRVLDDAEKRGYIDFARRGAGVVDRVVTSFTEEDVEALGDNIVLILETVKEMTQPEVMHMMRSTFQEVGEIEETEIPPSLFSLVRQMRDPEVRRGLARLLGLLRSMGSVEQESSEERKEAQS
jgi:uncharacterized protein YjgD (DUF1641 family)